MATTRSLLGLDGKQRGLHAISETVCHVLWYISEEKDMQTHMMRLKAD